MVNKVTFLLLACLLVYTTAMQETCTSQGVRYVNRSSFHSIKPDGSHYRCRCAGNGCIRITCDKISEATTTAAVEEEEQEEDEGITGEVPGGQSNGNRRVAYPYYPSRNPIRIRPNQGGYGGVMKVIGGASGTCNDEQSGRTFERGASFIRLTAERIRQSCTCPLVGAPRIRCKIAGCKLPDPPQGTPSYSYIDGCYDPWNNQEYRSGTTYNRTRYMDLDNQIIGVYSCSCLNNMMRCSAVDIPCCNLETGVFVPVGERFITIHRTIKMECSCQGQRGRYSRCARLDGTNPFGPGGRLVGRPNRVNRPSFRPVDHKCTDKFTRETYYPNQVWYQDKGSEGTWKCRCKLSGSILRTLCNWHSF